MAWPTLLPLVLVALLVGGCGGGSSQPGGSGAPNSQSQALATFLKAIKPVRESGNACAAQFKTDVAPLSENDPGAWPGIAAKMKKDDTCIRGVGDELAAIQAPGPVANAYAGYVSQLGGLADAGDAMANDIKRKDLAALPADESLAQKSAAGRSAAFRVALIQYAAQLGVTLPAWVRNIGTGK